MESIQVKQEVKAVQWIESDLTFKVQALKSINAIVGEEAVLNLVNGKLAFRSMDNAQIAMLDINGHLLHSKVSDNGYNDYSSFGLNVKALNAFVKSDKTDFTLTFDNETGKFLAVKSEFNQLEGSILDLNIHTPRKPLIQDVIAFNVNAVQLTSLLKQHYGLGSHIVIELKDNNLVLETKSDNGNLVNSILPFGCMLKDKARGMYPTDYLLKFLKSFKFSKSDLIEVKLKSNAPIELVFKLNDNVFSFFLAPRVEN